MTEKQTETSASAAKSPPTKPRRRRAGAHRSLQATVVCVGILSMVLVMFPHAQAPRTNRKVTGVVVAAATEQPVPNARVEYEVGGQWSQTTVTDTKGHFEFSTGSVGVVTVTARNFGTARRRWPPRAPQLRIALFPPAGLHGTVRDLATGAPLRNAVVTVIAQHPNDLVFHTVRTERGVFEIDDLPPGPTLVTARSPGFAPFLGRTTVESGRQRDARIGLLLAAYASGHVRGAGGTPVQRALVRVKYPAMENGGLLAGLAGGEPLTSADGSFAIQNLVPDTTIALQAELDGRRSSVETVTIGPGMEHSNIILVLP